MRQQQSLIDERLRLAGAIARWRIRGDRGSVAVAQDAQKALHRIGATDERAGHASGQSCRRRARLERAAGAE
jgi:hypothetical protein